MQHVRFSRIHLIDMNSRLHLLEFIKAKSPDPTILSKGNKMFFLLVIHLLDNINNIPIISNNERVG